MGREIVPEVVAVGPLERWVAGAHGLWQLLPGAHDVGAGKHLGVRAHRPRSILPEQVPYGSEMNPAFLVMGAQPEGRQGAEEAAEGRGVSAGRLGKLLHGAWAIGEVVGEAEDRH